MLRKKKILTAALCAGGVVLSAALTAAETETTIVSQQFARVTGDLTQLGGDKPGTWEGYGSVTNQTAGYAKPAGVGSPINAATDKLYLSVDGSVICTAATEENKPATVDMMIQISRPDEALALPTGEETTGGIQIALGVETDGTLKAYCKNRADVTGWYALGTTEYAEGEWHRVSFTFDYGNGTCQIRLDGEAPVRRTECTADILISAGLPQSYVSDAATRVDLYRRIAMISTPEDYRDMQDELLDRFGDLPKAAQALLDIALLRADASRAGIFEISQKNGALLLFFRPEALEGAAKVCAAPQYKGRIFLSAGEKPYITLKLRPADDPLEQAKGLLALYTGEKS